MAFGGWLGQTVSDVGQGAYNTLDRLGSAAEDAGKSLFGAADDLSRLDFSGASDNLSSFEDAGNDAFGTGGWYKAGLNMALLGQPFDPFSDILAKKIEGEKVNNSDIARLAASQLPSYDTGYGKTVNSALNQGVKDAAVASVSGGDVGKAFGQGAVQGGTMSTLGDYFNNLGKDSSAFEMPSMSAETLPNYFEGAAGGAMPGMPSFNAETPNQMGGSYWDQLKNNNWFKGTMGFLSGAHPLFGAINNQIYGKPAQQAARMPDTDMYAQTLRDIGIDPASVRGGSSSQPKQDPFLQLGQVVGSMYNTGKAQRRLDDMAKQMDVSRGAYTTQMGKELAAQDAARGKRSQYGSRAVELQAKLAALDAQRMPTLQKMYEGQDMLNNRQLINALRLYETGRQPATEMYDSLKGMWNGNG